MKAKLEIVANAVFIVAGLLLLAVLVRNYAGAIGLRGPVTIREADILVQPPRYDWGNANRTVVLALSSECQYCEASAPFYRRLAALDSSGESTAELLAVFPDVEEAARSAMQRNGLAIEYRSGFSFAPWKISGTPTIAIVSSTGRVLQLWTGQLSSEREEVVMESIRSSAPRRAGLVNP